MCLTPTSGLLSILSHCKGLQVRVLVHAEVIGQLQLRQMPVPVDQQLAVLNLLQRVVLLVCHPPDQAVSSSAEQA